MIRNRGLKDGLLYTPGKGHGRPSLLLGVLVVLRRQTSGSWELASRRAAGEEGGVPLAIVGSRKNNLKLTHTRV